MQKPILTIKHLIQNERDPLTNPYWIEDPELRKGEVDYLSTTEIQFWKDLLDKYLYPIDANKDEEVIVYINFFAERILIIKRVNYIFGAQ